MSEWFMFMLGSLATYRVSLMFVKEAGPFRIFERLRRRSKREAKEWLSCIFCFSVSVAAVITAYMYWLNEMDLFDTPLYCLAMSAVAVMLNQYFTKGKL